MGTPAYIISQVFGYGATAVALISTQQKRMNIILLLAILSNLFSALSNMLLGGFSGASVCFVAIAQTIVSFLYERKGKKVPVPVTVAFVIAYIAVTALTFKVALDILPGVAALLYAAAVLQQKPLIYRILMSINCCTWILYVLIPTPPNIALFITFMLELSFLIVGIVRVDILGKKKNGEDA